MAANTNDEIAALDRVMTRLALTKDDQLEQLVGKLVCPVLKKLSVSDIQVRTKVLQLLGLISTKVKGLPDLKLPAKLLLNLLNETPPDQELVRNTTLVYFQMAFERCDKDEKFDLVGALLTDVATRPAAQQRSFLQLAMRGLEAASKGLPNHIADSKQALHDALPMLTNPADLDAFMQHALKTMLYLPNYTLKSRHDINPPPAAAPNNLMPLLEHQNQAAAVLEQARLAAVNSAAAAEQAEAAADDPEPEERQRAPPGLNMIHVATLTHGNPYLDSVSLSRQKLAILHVIAVCDEITPQACVLHLQAGCCDSNEDVIRDSELLLRKKCGMDGMKPDVDVEDRALLSHTFKLILGSNGSGGPAAAQGGNSAIVTEPCSHALHIRLLRMCCKSLAAANFFPQTLQVIASGLYGKTASLRVKQSAMEFSVWVFKHATDDQLKPMAPLVFKGLLHLLTNLDISEQNQVMMLRGFLYQAVGQLALRTPWLFKDHPDTPEMLFGALASEPAGIKATVQEAINSLAGAYKGVTGPAAQDLKRLLTSSVQSRYDSVRLCAISWAREIYDFDDPYARHLCLIAASDTKHEIAQAGLRGLGLNAALDPANLPTHNLPALQPMLVTLRSEHTRLRTTPLPGASLAMPAASMLALLRFLRACADAPSTHDVTAEQDAMDIDEEGDSVPMGADELAKCDGVHSEGYLLLLEHALIKDSPSDLQEAAFQALLKLAADDRKFVASAYSSRSQYLRAYLSHVQPSIRTAAARMLGIVASEANDEFAVQTLATLQATFGVSGSGEGASKSKYEEQHGSIMASGFVAAAVGKRSSEAIKQAVVPVVAKIVQALGHSEVSLASAAALSLGHIQLACPLPISHGVPPTEDLTSLQPASCSGAVEGTFAGVVKTVSQLTKDPRSASTPKLRLQSITAIGYLAWGCEDKDYAVMLVKTLLAMTPSGDSEDIHFTVGEAISMSFGGVTVSRDEVLFTDIQSLAVHYRLLSAAPKPPGGPVTTPATPVATDSTSSAVRTAAEDLILSTLWEKLFSSVASTRCAAAVWLVSLLTYCRMHPRLMPQLMRAQEACAQLLGDSNELTQEMASKGMSIIYELGDEETKEKLVQSLVGTLQGNTASKKAIKVTGDVEIFDKGALGKTPGGGSISTYKELCSLATDMGQPDLIYKFMDLANQATTLNSKRGAAFGFATIANLSVERLKPHVASLLPKLYRYQYDPNAKVQEAMKQILTALVPQKAAALEEHFSVVLVDLLKELGSRLWRNRQAACLATGDLLQGCRWPAIAPHFEQLWSMTLRVADDIKESVRVNGTRLLRSVKALSIRLADKSHTAAADSTAAISIVMPMLLENGILSDVTLIKAQAIDTISCIVDVAAPAQVAGQLPAIVSTLLESLSSLETSGMNHIQMHAERLGVDGDQLEDKRVSASTRTPMNSTLERCSRLISPDLLPEITGILTHLIKRGTGLNTRVGAAKFAVTLQSRLSDHMQRPAGDLLKALVPSVAHERSAVIRKAFAQTIGSLAKVASVKRADWLIASVLALYSDPGDNDSRLVSGLVMQATARQAPDSVASNSGTVLPVAFRGRFDSLDDVAALWQDVWSEGSTSEASAMRLYGSEIVATLATELQRDAWPLRVAAAKAIGGMAVNAPDALCPHAQGLMQLLLSQLPGRLWQGKGSLLDAMAAVVIHCAKEFTGNKPQVSDADVVAALVDASQKKQTEYRDSAMAALQKVLIGLEGRDHLSRMGVILEAAHASSSADESPSRSSEMDTGEDTVKSIPMKACLGALGAACCHTSSSTVAVHLQQLVSILKVSLHPQQPWTLRMQAFETMSSVVLAAGGLSGGPELGIAAIGKEGRIPDDASVRLCEDLITPATSVSDEKLSQVRIASLDSLKALILASDGAKQLSTEHLHALVQQIRSVATSDRTSAVKAHAVTVMATIRAQAAMDAGITAMEEH